MLCLVGRPQADGIDEEMAAGFRWGGWVGRVLAPAESRSAFAGRTKGDDMKAFLVLTEAQPRIVATPKWPRSPRQLAASLSELGIDRFIAHEVDVERLREIYGFPFDVIEEEIRNGKDFQVLDSNGHNVLSQIQRADLGPGIAHNF